jgi:hypothetical protein
MALEPLPPYILPLLGDQPPRPRHMKGKPAQSIEADIADHDSEIKRDQRDSDMHAATLHAHRRRSGRAVFQDESAENDGGTLQKGRFACDLNQVGS